MHVCSNDVVTYHVGKTCANSLTQMQNNKLYKDISIHNAFYSQNLSYIARRKHIFMNCMLLLNVLDNHLNPEGWVQLVEILINIQALVRIPSRPPEVFLAVNIRAPWINRTEFGHQGYWKKKKKNLSPPLPIFGFNLRVTRYTISYIFVCLRGR